MGLRGTRRRLWALTVLCALLGALSACSSLPAATGAKTIRTYLLERPLPVRTQADPSGPVLLVSPAWARPGYGSSRMVYTQRPYELNHYAYSEWAEDPPRMLVPSLVAALEASGRFQAVVEGPQGVLADVRLDPEIVAVQHQIDRVPSQGRIVVRAQLIDLETRRVLGTRVFEAAEPAPTGDPYGGVVAVNRALARVLDEIVAFCLQTLPGSDAANSRSIPSALR